MLFAKLVGDLVDDRAEVWLAGSRADDEEIGHCGQGSHIEDDEVIGFLIVGEFTAKQCEFLRIHWGEGCLSSF